MREVNLHNEDGMSEATLEREDAEAEETGNRRRDPELLAIERVVRILDELRPGERRRAINYLDERYPDQSVIRELIDDAR